MKKSFLSGFTLSELLIALAIVGIIAALTIPAVTASYQKASQLLALKAVYANLVQNLTILQGEKYMKKGLVNSILASDEADTFWNYYKISKRCGNEAQPCFADSYRSLDNSSQDFSCDDGTSVLLVNSAAMCIIPATVSEVNSKKVLDTPAIVYVDVNGSGEPNIGGRDMFTFNIYNDFSIDEVPPEDVANGVAQTNRQNLFNANCRSSTVGVGCFARILSDDWKMNY